MDNRPLATVETRTLSTAEAAMDDEWIVDPRDQDRIWNIAIALLNRSPNDGGPAGLEHALQLASAELFSAKRALRRGVRFYVSDGETQSLRQIRSLENGAWVQERAKKASSHTKTD